MNEIVIQGVVRYIDEVLYEPRKNWPEYWFNQRVYSRWAAFEILNDVMNRASSDPLVVIREFIIKMDEYSDVREGYDESYIF